MRGRCQKPQRKNRPVTPGRRTRTSAWSGTSRYWEPGDQSAEKRRLNSTKAGPLCRLKTKDVKVFTPQNWSVLYFWMYVYVYVYQYTHIELQYDSCCEANLQGSPQHPKVPALQPIKLQPWQSRDCCSRLFHKKSRLPFQDNVDLRNEKTSWTQTMVHWWFGARVFLGFYGYPYHYNPINHWLIPSSAITSCNSVVPNLEWVAKFDSSPLINDAWKSTFSFRMVPFQGAMLNFVDVGYLPKIDTIWREWRNIYKKSVSMETIRVSSPKTEPQPFRWFSHWHPSLFRG